MKETETRSSQDDNGGNPFRSASTANNPSNSPFLEPYNWFIKLLSSLSLLFLVSIATCFHIRPKQKSWYLNRFIYSAEITSALMRERRESVCLLSKVLERLAFIRWSTRGVTEGPSICGRYWLSSFFPFMKNPQLRVDRCGKLRVW